MSDDPVLEASLTLDTTMTVSAYGQLRHMVLSGVIAGGQLVQERRMAEQLGISRTPVREALGRLEGEGLLRRDGRLLFSVSISVPEVMEILTVRRLLEAEATLDATRHMRSTQIETIRAAILGMDEPCSVTDDEHWANDDLLHLSIARASGNNLLLRLISDLRQRTRMFGLRRIPGRFSIGKAEHLAILDAMAVGDAELAAKRMQLHIDQAREAIVAALAGAPR